jgi:DNA-binding MarR family transcriptional regulator
LAGVLARMEELELVQRERMAQDARRVMVKLAPKGDRLFDEIAPLIERQYRMMEKAWGKGVLDDLSSALAGFIAAQATPVPQVELPPRVE